MIRPAKSSDLEVVRRIAREAYQTYVSRIGREPAPMIADFHGHLDAGELWVLDLPPVTGYIVMYEKDGALQIDNLAVAPLSHGSGFGRQLLDHAEERAVAAGLPLITLYTNVHMKENLSFYPAHGFSEIARRHEDGFDRVFFSKSLAARG